MHLETDSSTGGRYRWHFRNPVIHEFDMKREVRLYGDQWKQPVLDMIDN